MARAPKHHVYILLTSIPAGMSHSEAVVQVSALAKCEQPPVNQSTKLNFPVIVRDADAMQGPGIVAVLRRNGFGADYVPLAEVKENIPVLQAKSIAPALGSNDAMFMVTFVKRDVPPQGLMTSNIKLLVRGRCVTTKKGVETQSILMSRPTLDTSRNPLDVMPRRGLGGMMRDVLDIESEDITPGQRSLITAEVLDIHVHEGPPIRVDANRFHFATLDQRLAYSDAENLDALTHRLASAATNAVIDLNFNRSPLPRPLLRDLGLAVNSSGDTKTTEIFGVYSAWALVMHRRGTRPFSYET